MPESHANARTPRRKLLSERQFSRLLSSRRADDQWSERQRQTWREFSDPWTVHRAICDSQNDYAARCEERLLLAVGTLCMQSDRPDIWRKVYEAWDEAPAAGGDVVLLDELKNKAQRGEM